MVWQLLLELPEQDIKSLFWRKHLRWERFFYNPSKHCSAGSNKAELGRGRYPDPSKFLSYSQGMEHSRSNRIRLGQTQ